jgi:hypothetical protein
MGTEGMPEYDRRKAVRIVAQVPCTVSLNLVIQVYDRDPVRTIQLGAHLAANLRQAESICGAEAFRVNYLGKADPATLKQIQDEVAYV